MSNCWKKEKESLVYDGYRKIKRVTFKMPDGSISDFDLLDEGETVAIVGFTKNYDVIMVEQYRPGPGKILLEIPGGNVDKGESPYLAATRELREETGYSGEFKQINSSYSSAYSNRRRNNFIALNCKKISDSNYDKNEFINIKIISLDEFKSHVRGGDLTDVETGYAALDMMGFL